MSTLYDLTLKKEVARECAWGVMAKFSKISDKVENSKLLEVIEEDFGKMLFKLSGMSEEEVDRFNAIIDFFNDSLKRIQGE